jgi:uncharacterized protein
MASEDCNFRCIYCYEKFERGTMEPWVRRGLIHMLERRAPQLREVQVSYFGGEPLLGIEAISEIAPGILTLTEKNGIKLTSGMTTNG